MRPLAELCWWAPPNCCCSFNESRHRNGLEPATPQQIGPPTTGGEFASGVSVDDNSPVTGDEQPDSEKKPVASKPDGGLNDGGAAMAILVLAVVLIVVVVILI